MTMARQLFHAVKLVQLFMVRMHALKLSMPMPLPKAHQRHAKVKKHVMLLLNVSKETMLLTQNTPQLINVILLILNSDTHNGKTKPQSSAQTQPISRHILVLTTAFRLLEHGNTEQLTSTKINQDSEPLVKPLPRKEPKVVLEKRISLV